jgi:hypothetical protein
MEIKLLRLISRILGVLMIVCVIPSCAFASENNKLHPQFDAGLCPAGNVTAENFTSVQTSMLDSISKQISELQSFYTNISEASNASELQEILENHIPANVFMGPGGMNKEPGRMNKEPGGMNKEPGGMNKGFAGMNVFNLDRIANVTDDNFTDVQTELVASLGNMTDRLDDQLNDTKVSQDSNRTEGINERIAELQNLSTEVSEASTAAELKEVVFTFLQTQAVNSLVKEIELLQAQVNDDNCTCGNTTELSNRITELTTLKENISGAESLEDLKTIMSSNNTLPRMEAPMRQGDHQGNGGPMDRSPKTQGKGKR